MIFHTTTLTAGSMVIQSGDGALKISIEPNDGSSCTVLGSLPFQGQSPNAIVLNANQSLTLSAMSTASPIDGLTITWVSGTIDIVVGV